MTWKRSLTIDLEPWPYPGPRVLIEHPDPDRALELSTAIRHAGYAVGVCRGPEPAAAQPTRCPLHGLEPCIAVEGADLVVTALDLDERDGRNVVRGLRTRYPSRPVVVLATPVQTLVLGDALEGCTVLPVDATPTSVVAAVLERLPAGAHARAAGSAG